MIGPPSPGSYFWSFLSREKKDDMKHWCSTCHTHFTSSLSEHRRTEEHKVIHFLRRWWMRFMEMKHNIAVVLPSVCPQLASRIVISSCTLCKKHFRTSQIFVEHLQSAEHRQRVEEVHFLSHPGLQSLVSEEPCPSMWSICSCCCRPAPREGGLGSLGQADGHRHRRLFFGGAGGQRHWGRESCSEERRRPRLHWDAGDQFGLLVLNYLEHWNHLAFILTVDGLFAGWLVLLQRSDFGRHGQWWAVRSWHRLR